MCAFGRLYRLGTAVETGDNHRRELYNLAACNGKEGSLMMVTRDYEGKVELILSNCPFALCRISKTVPGGVRGKGTLYRSKEIDISSGRLLLSVGKGEIYSVSFFNK